MELLTRSRGVSGPLGDGGSWWQLPNGPMAEHRPQSQFLLLFLTEPLRWVSSTGTMWRVGVPCVHLNPHPELEKWRMEQSVLCRGDRSWEPQGSGTGHSFSLKGESRGQTGGGMCLGGA